jgi:glycosyltransferase involved in cell wall biosynthesis
MAVSVALCTHNGERFLVEQLESIVRQTVQVDQVVVSDDASHDGTVGLVRAFFEDHPDAPPLKLIENPVALGVTRNFEQAIAACSGEIVLLSDQDDVWAPDRVEKTLAAFDAADVVLVHGNARLIDGRGEVLPATLFGAYGIDERTRALEAASGAFDLFLRRNLVTGATSGVRRDLAILASPFPDYWVHDEWLAVVAASTGRIVPLVDPLIDYRQHVGNEIGAADTSFRAKLERLVAPGYQRNRRLLGRALALEERYPAFGAVPGGEEAVAQKVLHERARSALGVHRITRIAPVLREWGTGRYGRFGGGAQDVLRDLIQPLDPSS